MVLRSGLQSEWLKGLTLSADFWHIDLRSIAALPGAQFILAS